MIILIRKVLKTIRVAEREKEQLNKEYEILHEKNAKRSATVKKNIDHKSKEFASKKASRDKHFNIIRSK